MRGLLLVLLTTGLPFTMCLHQGDRACTALYAYGVSAHVTNADIGQPINNATLTLTEGDYSEVMMLIPTGDYVGAGERPGTYTMTIDIPGVGSTVVSDIVVGFDGCHVIGKAFEVKVQGGQIVVTPFQSGQGT